MPSWDDSDDDDAASTVVSKKRQRDDPCSSFNDDNEESLSALDRFERAHRQKLWLQTQLQLANDALHQARQEIVDQGLNPPDSILVLDDDSLKLVLMFCDPISLLRMEQSCRRIATMTDPAWERLDEISVLIEEMQGWLDIDEWKSTPKLRVTRFWKAARYAKSLEPHVAAHGHFSIHSGEGGEEDSKAPWKCYGCNHFPATTNKKCLEVSEPQNHGHFLRIFTLPGYYEQEEETQTVVEQSDDENEQLPESLPWPKFCGHNIVEPDDDRTLVWQGFLSETNLINEENSSELHLELGDTCSEFPVYFKKLLNLISHERDEEADEESCRRWMQTTALGNLGFVLVTMDVSNNDSTSLVNATTQFSFLLDQEIWFNPMKLETHSRGRYDDYITNLYLQLSPDEQHVEFVVCFTLL
jgi:hypothetical protein